MVRVLLTALIIAFLNGCASSQSVSAASAPVGSAPVLVSSPSSPGIDIRASRVFAGPLDFPPSSFAAYGIVAFTALATTPESIERYIAICQGYLAAIPSSKELVELNVLAYKQMATVWPLSDADLASRLNESDQNEIQCAEVVASIDLPTSKNSIYKAKNSTSGPGLDREGPYLLAWSPSRLYEDPAAPVLVLDLTDVINAEQATRLFTDWAVEIEQDSDLWHGGWNIDKLRSKIQLLADRWGSGVLAFFGASFK